MEIARGTDLPDLLSALGYQVLRIGHYHTTKEMDSLRIKNRRTWYRYSEKVGGDAITFLQHFCGKSFPEAVEYLLDFHGRIRDAPAAQPEHRLSTVSEEPPKPFKLPEAHGDQRRVFAYLRKRGIASQVIRSFIVGGLLYEDLDLLGGLIENLSVTEADAKALLAALPEDLSAERREVLKTACSLVGKVNYFWGGKSLTLGWDSR